MRLIRVRCEEEMAEVTANIIVEQIEAKSDSVIGLPTGNTPIRVYEKLTEKYRAGLMSFASIRTINLDEYVGLSPTSINSYRYFMNHYLFENIDIDISNTHIPNGVAVDIESECRHYDDIIRGSGGIDMQLLGIGHNGHIGFNEPSDHFVYNTNRVILAENTREVNRTLFVFGPDEDASFPTCAITMGIGAIMSAKKVILIAKSEKKEIIELSMNGDITPQIPASILKLHPDLTIVLASE